MPARKDVAPTSLDDSGDHTIRGNLGTWDTGLTNYVYLPSHPKGHPINLKGVYTIRLVVTGDDGSTAEDRVPVEVGDVVPNAWGGVVTSTDRKVSLIVPEQAITNSFRVMSIKPAPGETPSVPRDYRAVGPIYEFRDPGEKFTKPARLQFEVPGSAEDLNRVRLFSYNTAAMSWQRMDCLRDDHTIFAPIQKASQYYALMASTVSGDGCGLAPSPDQQKPSPSPILTGGLGRYLVRGTFEMGTDGWSNRDSDAGAEVSLDNLATLDGSRCLKISNRRTGGNLAVNILRTPFDARDYSVVQFDYNIPPGVKTNFMVKTAGRWYDIQFTDDPKELLYKRVNIAPIGTIKGVVADGRWHTGRFNLYDMLRTKTGNFLVQEMIMADWDVTGFMKLVYGHNPKGATYYIDNFTISKDTSAGLRPDGDTLLVDTFNQKKDSNALGGSITIFSNGNAKTFSAEFVPVQGRGIGNALKLSSDFSASGTFAGYVTSLQDLDLRGYGALTLEVKTIDKGQELLVGLKDNRGKESKLSSARYTGPSGPMGWHSISIPLAAFTGIEDWAHLENLSFSFVKSNSAGASVMIDNVAFEKNLHGLVVDDFEGEQGRNLLGRGHTTLTDGPAAIGAGYASDGVNRFYEISFGGSIGEGSVGIAGLAYALWSTDLGGIDCSQCGVLSFMIRGAAGGEKPNLYLDDGNHRWGVSVAKYAPLTTSWQRVEIPLADLAENGVDLTHLSRLQIAFEWERMSGTIYLDKIRFGPAYAHSGDITLRTNDRVRGGGGVARE